VPAWLDGKATRMWLDYTIPADRDREAYDKQALSVITGSISSLTTQQITFKALTPLEDTGAAEISVMVRSKYFDSRDRAVRQKPAVPITEDEGEVTVGPIYLVNRQPGESVGGDPLFEYTLSVVMPDGATHPGATWIPSDQLRVLIGAAQIRQAVGHVPGEEEQPAPTETPTTQPVETAAPEGNRITFKLLKPLEDTGAVEMVIAVRSKRFSPEGGEVRRRDITGVAEDNKEYTVGPIYLGGRQPGEVVEGDPLYEYTVQLIMPDGNTLAADTWLPADNLRTLIGSHQIRQCLGDLYPEEGGEG
jgi:hypothetical protein